MSYLVLARKWRPVTFAEVIGQEHVTVTLKNAIENNRLASAYIFSGPRGVGKTTTARILAKALNCENGPTTTPCNTCSVCKEITSGNSIDVLEIDGASNRGIDEIRNLRESTRYTSAQQRSKIYIIDEVHMLTTEAFNALLKTLEEPPPHVIFIFATTESNKVPATILSRCQRFDFRRIPVKKIVEQLQKICASENIKIDESALELIAGKSEGCMRDSQSLLDQVISFCGTDIKEDEVAELLGVIGAEIYIEILDAVANRNAAEMFGISQKIYDKGYSFRELLQGLAEHINKVLMAKLNTLSDTSQINESNADAFKRQIEAFEETDLIRLYQAVVEAANDIRWSNNPQLHVEMLLIRLTKMTKTIEFHDLLSDIAALKKKDLIQDEPQEKPAYRIVPEVNTPKKAGGLFGELNGLGEQKVETKPADEKKTEAEIQEKQPVTLPEIKSRWPQIVAAIRKTKVSIGAFLDEGVPIRLSGNQLEIAFQPGQEFHVKSLNDDRTFIQKTISKIVNKSVLIHCQIISESVEPVPDVETDPVPEVVEQPKQPEEKQKISDNWLSENPLAQQLIQSLDGKEIN